MVTCIYCGSESKLKHNNMRHPLWKEMVNIDMYECNTCKSLTTYPMPSQESLTLCYKKYSLEGYPEHKSKVKKNSNQNTWYEEILRIFEFQPTKNALIADVGAGEGLLEKAICATGYSGSIECFDYHPVPEMVRYLQINGAAINWQLVDLNDREWISECKFDSVFCISVIEHVADPVQLMTDLLRMVKKNGELCIIGPCVDTIFYSLLKDKWVYMTPGEHLTIPSVNGLKRLMSRLDVRSYKVSKIPVSYSLKYIVDSIFKINFPALFDVVLKLPVGAFSLKIIK